MVGFASTASFRSDAFPAKGDAYGIDGAASRGFAELPGPAVVVFQDLDDPAVGATFGEVMCSTYKAFGSVGLITSRRRPRPGAGQGDRLSGVHRLDDLLARLLPHAAHRPAGARRRPDRRSRATCCTATPTA